MKKSWKNTLLFWMLFVVSVFAEIASGQDAILQLGRQMANIREMLETYIMLGARIEYDAPKERLRKMMEEYEQTLGDMAKRYEDPVIQESVARSKKAWQPLKKDLLAAFETEDAKKLREEAMRIHSEIRGVIKELEKMKEWIISREKIPNVEALDAAIEIGASSQRLSSHYMMKMWGLPDPTIMDHWNKGVAKYEQAIDLLKGSKFAKDSAFKKLLKAVERDLNYFKTVITFEDDYMPVVVHRRGKDALERSMRMAQMILTDG